MSTDRLDNFFIELHVGFILYTDTDLLNEEQQTTK